MEKKDQELNLGFDPTEDAYLDALSPSKPRDRAELRRAFALTVATFAAPTQSKIVDTAREIEAYLKGDLKAKPGLRPVQ